MNRSKIEWCDYSLHLIMCFLVAAIAERPNIEPMPFCISKMVMIVGSLFAALEARKGFNWGESAYFNSITNGIDSRLSFAFRTREIARPFSGRYPATRYATSRQSIGSSPIPIKEITWIPLPAFVAPLQTCLNLFLIFLKRKAEATRRNLRDAKSRSHNHAPYIDGVLLYPFYQGVTT